MPQRSQIPLEQNPTFTAQKSSQGGFARRFLGHQIVIFYTKRNSTKLFLKLSDLKSNFTLNLGYLHPALNNPVLNFKRKKNLYIYIYIHAQVIQNCTTLSRTDIYNMNGKLQDFKRRKRKPGKRCVVMFITSVDPSPVSS